MTGLLAVSVFGSAPFEDICYATWSGLPPHGAAPRLIQLVQQAASDSGCVKPAPADVAAAWLVHTLGALGFEGPSTDGTMSASVDCVGSLIKQQNRARQRTHADADASRRRLLASCLDEVGRSDDGRGDLGAAREALRVLLAHSSTSPAAAPVLAGIGAFFAAQSASPARAQTWHCSREALLNGGDDLVPKFAAALRALRLRPHTSLEAGGGGDVSFSIGRQSWLRAELASLASLSTRYSKRSVRASATGSVEPTGDAFEEAGIEGLARVRCVLAAWLCRLLG